MLRSSGEASQEWLIRSREWPSPQVYAATGTRRQVIRDITTKTTSTRSTRQEVRSAVLRSFTAAGSSSNAQVDFRARLQANLINLLSLNSSSHCVGHISVPCLGLFLQYMSALQAPSLV